MPLIRDIALNIEPVHYQPLLDLATGNISCCETLVRWRDEERGLVSPAEFIPLARKRASSSRSANGCCAGPAPKRPPGRTT